MAGYLRRVLMVALLLGMASGYLYNLKEGESCHTRQGKPGTCTGIKRCPGAIYRFLKGMKLKKCSHDGDGLVICCESTTPRDRVMPLHLAVRGNKTVKMPHSLKQTKSEAMCVEYGEYAYVRRRLETLLPREQYVKELKCFVAEELIVGGKKAGPKEFPHMAALGYVFDEMVMWACGGSLISDKFVLTAAHCIYYDPLQDGMGKYVSIVRLGDLNLVRDDDDAKPQTLTVTKIMRHPQYKVPSKYHDIALLQLEASVTFNIYVRPACLHAMHGIPEAKYTTATGWGLTDKDDTRGSDDLMKVSVQIERETDMCSLSYRNLKLSLPEGIQNATMICARDITGKKDTCMGDSGGPLQVRLKSPICMYGIIGVTSFGSDKCQSAEMPAVYTRVSYYVPWIESEVWP